MGIEYIVNVNLPSAADGELILQRAYSRKGVRTDHGWEYRSDESFRGMPEALAKVEPHSFYIVIYSALSGLSAELLGFVVASSLHCGQGCQIQIEEL